MLTRLRIIPPLLAAAGFLTLALVWQIRANVELRNERDAALNRLDAIHTALGISNEIADLPDDEYRDAIADGLSGRD